MGTRKPRRPGNPIAPPADPLAGIGVDRLVDQYFSAYNAARIREVCHLWARELARPDVVVGMSLAGALTPAGLGVSCLIPLIEAGLVDFITSTGANLYHDAHYALDIPLYQSTPHHDDVALRREEWIRIYDVLMGQQGLFDTDEFYFRLIRDEAFQASMPTWKLHGLLGERIARMPHGDRSVLAAAWRRGVPIFAPSPGDSTIGMNVAVERLRGNKLEILPEEDVLDSAALVHGVKREGKKVGVVILGGGAPKNFLLQIEPMLSEILKLESYGHEFFVQITDARPDTGGLSGATPSEAVSWGKIRPDQLPSTVVAYVDTTVALPIIAAYVLSSGAKKPHARLADRLPELRAGMEKAYFKKWPKTKKRPLKPRRVRTD
jgi:deoxyhypusine synthase